MGSTNERKRERKGGGRGSRETENKRLRRGEDTSLQQRDLKFFDKIIIFTLFYIVQILVAKTASFIF